MRPLYLRPTAELVDLHEFEVGKSIFVAFAHLRQSRTEIGPGREFLRLRRIQEGEIRFRRFPRAALVDGLIDYGDRRLSRMLIEGITSSNSPAPNSLAASRVSFSHAISTSPIWRRVNVMVAERAPVSSTGTFL